MSLSRWWAGWATMVKNYRDTTQAPLTCRRVALAIWEHSIRLLVNMFRNAITKAQSSSLSPSIVKMWIAQKFRRFNLARAGLKITNICLKTSLSCKIWYRVLENKQIKTSTVKSEQSKYPRKKRAQTISPQNICNNIKKKNEAFLQLTQAAEFPRYSWGADSSILSTSQIRFKISCLLTIRLQSTHRPLSTFKRRYSLRVLRWLMKDRQIWMTKY